MNQAATFRYDRFRSLSGPEVGKYVEPFLGDIPLHVPQEAIERILRDLPDYDEDHLVYAIELGAVHDPARLAPHVPQFLRHQHRSVRCAASRFLVNLPDLQVNRALVDSVRMALSEYPKSSSREREFFTEVLWNLERRLTNRNDSPA